MNEEKSKELLNELINISKSDINDYMLSDIKLGDMLNKFNKKSTKLDNSAIKNGNNNKPKFEFNFELGDIKINKNNKKDHLMPENSRHNKHKNDDEIFLYTHKPKLKSENLADIKSLDIFPLSNNLLDSDDKKNANRITTIKEINEDFELYEPINIDEEFKKSSNIFNINNDIINIDNKSNDFEIKDGFKITIFDKENNKVKSDKENEINIIDDLLESKNEKNYDIFDTSTKLDIVQKIEYQSFCRNENKKIDELKLHKTKLQIFDNFNYEENKYIIEKNDLKYEIYDKFQKTTILSEIHRINGIAFEIDEKYLYIGTNNGSLYAYKLSDEKLFVNLAIPFTNLTTNTNNISITALSVSPKYVLCGYSNGYIALYKKEVDKLKLINTITSVTQNNIIEIKINSDIKDILYIYLSDSQEYVYQIIININKIISNKITTHKIIGPSKKDNSIIKNPYYLIDINPFNPECIAVANSKRLAVLIVQTENTKLYESKSPSLKFCFFSNHIQDKNKIFISIENTIIKLQINDEYSGLVQDNSIIKLNNNIIKIGLFKEDLIYVLDDKNIITIISSQDCQRNYEDKNLCNMIDISGGVPFDSKYISVETNYKYILSDCFGILGVFGNNKFEIIQSISPKESIMRIINKNNENKWDVVFDLCTKIYNGQHPLWKYEKINDCSLFFHEITLNLLDNLLNKIKIYKKNKEIENFKENLPTKEKSKIVYLLNQAFHFLFNIQAFNFILNDDDSNGLYHKFLNEHLENIYYYLLENYILENQLKIKGIPVTFITKMIKIYSDMNRKTWLTELILHLDRSLLIKNETFLMAIEQNNLINFYIYEIINEYDFLFNENYSYEKPIELLFNILIKSEKDSNNNDNINKELIDSLFNKNIDQVNIDRYNDNIIYSKDYIRLKILWYINYIFTYKIEEDDETKNKEKLLTESINKIIKLLLNNFKILVLNVNKEKNLEQEFLLVFSLIINNNVINKYCDLNMQEIINDLYNIINEVKGNKILFYNFILKTILDNKNIETSNEFKIEIVFYLLNVKIIELNDYKIQINEFENNTIEFIKLIDSFTIEENDKIASYTKKIANYFPKIAEYINNNFYI